MTDLRGNGRAFASTKTSAFQLSRWIGTEDADPPGTLHFVLPEGRATENEDRVRPEGTSQTGEATSGNRGPCIAQEDNGRLNMKLTPRRCSQSDQTIVLKAQFEANAISRPIVSLGVMV